MVSQQASALLPTGYDKSLRYVVLPPVFDMLKGAASRSIVTVVSPMITNMPSHTLHNHDYIPWGQIECWCVLRPAQTLPPKGSGTIIPMHLLKYKGYCRHWLLSTCAYNSLQQGHIHLIVNMHLTVNSQVGHPMWEKVHNFSCE